MLIKYGRQRFKVSNEHPYADAIVLLATAATRSQDGDAATERNDVKALWKRLLRGHKELLAKVAAYPTGISQADLLKALDKEWQELRGVHNGLARICETEGVDKPIQTTGYNSANRSYHMMPDVARTVLKLWKKDGG
ncbi:MAG TPA: hypothetical protein PK970_13320 [Hyphomicrobiaceae bacterium]|nr:hypothetical protein [Hyphomicrobiaceae bacterium]